MAAISAGPGHVSTPQFLSCTTQTSRHDATQEGCQIAWNLELRLTRSLESHHHPRQVEQEQYFISLSLIDCCKTFHDNSIHVLSTAAPAADLQ
eukprot:962192-Rhodomonas_salina.2